MGTTSSSLAVLKSDSTIKQFISKKNISPDNTGFWDLLLTRELPFRREDIRLLEETLQSAQETFLQNNTTSKNLSSLVHVFEAKCASLKTLTLQDESYRMITVQATTAALALRYCLRHLVQTLTEENVVHHFSPASIGDQQQNENEKGNPIAVIESLILTCIGTLVDIPVTPLTYELSVETMSVLIILLSVQMYSTRPASKSAIYRTLLGKNCSVLALVFTKTLFSHLIRQERPPKRDAGGSIILGIASGIWNVLSLGYGRTEEVHEDAILAKLSLLLLLILTNHCTSEYNPYREAVFQCTDSSALDKNEDLANSGFKLDFSALFTTFSSIQNDDQTTLLLYLLLHKNEAFRNYIVSRATDLDSLILPVLKVLYECPEKSTHHVYMALIVLLILSEDSLFNESVHDDVVKTVPWYKEKVLTDITLGNLIILVLIRAIQYNISRTRDKFLHTNLLATLANMSSSFKQLSPYVCQKLITLFTRLSKRFSRALQTINASSGIQNGSVSEQQQLPPQTSISISSDRQSDVDTDIMSATHASEASNHDLSIYEEVLRMLLEIINSCLASQMIYNPNLIYTLLYNRNILEPFSANPSFQDIVLNIESVLGYFHHQIQVEWKQEDTPSVSEVYEIIENSARKWPSEKLKNFPPLKFKYVEDDQPEEFFIPYIWQNVV